ncbi:cutinase family protein [Nocardia vulneris]|uniref:Cutinase n=1 Tax=Nocardia vulneris TaxID=1141657 RepID=A0ABR4Z695_9NOCA|nr:cutinase family protein [Nocardia vulneris]KIA60833.1 hypothetical protein FG87_34680 [Nocardia vulneris]
MLVPGTSETSATANSAQPAGLLAGVGAGLAARYGDDIAVRYLPYAAAPAPYRASQSGGVAGLTSLLGGLCDSTQVVLAGYSQGADIVGDVTSAIGHGRGPISAARVLAVGLLSDPRRDPDTPQLGAPAPGQGIAGPRAEDFGELAGRVRTHCAPGDLYCSTSPETSPALSAIGRAFTGTAALGTDSTSSDSAATTASGLIASSVTRQVVIVLGGLAGFAANLPTIVDDLAQLPNRVLAGDIAGAHQLAGDLNTQFEPLVTMAGKVDLHLVAQALSMAAPLDSSGTTATAAQIVDILARVDIARVARDAGIAQELTWRAVSKVSSGDPLGAGLEMIGLIPVAADLAGVAAVALTGEGGAQLAGLAQSFTTTTPSSPEAGAALAELAREGGDAARFYGGGVHQTGYHDAVTILLNWLTSQIDTAR